MRGEKGTPVKVFTRGIRAGRARALRLMISLYVKINKEILQGTLYLYRNKICCQAET